MKNSIIQTIENTIGYKFVNTSLLRQAFTRKSYSEEHREIKNNEGLEFVGDSALGVTVTRLLTAKFGAVDLDDTWICKFAEGELTPIRSQLTESKYLAARMDKLGLNEYLIMGRGDIKQGVKNGAHVKEDLFEAIVGAVAIDSNWNFDILQTVVSHMLDFDVTVTEIINKNAPITKSYVDTLQHWWQVRFGIVTPYVMMNSVEMLIGQNDCNTVRGGSGFNSCCLEYDGLFFVGCGATNTEARSICAKLVCEYLDKQGVLYERKIDVDLTDISPDNAINRLQELAQKGFISFPEYMYNKSGDDNCPSWECVCRIAGIDHVCRECSAKKSSSKKQAAYEMLLYVRCLMNR